MLEGVNQALVVARGPRRSRCDGQIHMKAGALAHDTLYGHVPAHELDEFLNDRQAEPRATARASARLVHAIETLEDMRQMIGGHAFTRIRHAQHDPPILHPSIKGDDASFRRVPNGVADEVGQDLPQAITVHEGWGQTRAAGWP